ncbi:hypothetical protein RHCRD62_40187 [Rhodococcus sp. RD6.2]|nr:hypothetical protein RHCRD62_40187 [Rhodococcus sp. RD6.2]
MSARVVTRRSSAATSWPDLGRLHSREDPGPIDSVRGLSRATTTAIGVGEAPAGLAEPAGKQVWADLRRPRGVAPDRG